MFGNVSGSSPAVHIAETQTQLNERLACCSYIIQWIVLNYYGQSHTKNFYHKLATLLFLIILYRRIYLETDVHKNNTQPSLECEQISSDGCVFILPGIQKALTVLGGWYCILVGYQNSKEDNACEVHRQTLKLLNVGSKTCWRAWYPVSALGYST